MSRGCGLNEDEREDTEDGQFGYTYSSHKIFMHNIVILMSGVEVDNEFHLSISFSLGSW